MHKFAGVHLATFEDAQDYRRIYSQNLDVDDEALSRNSLKAIKEYGLNRSFNEPRDYMLEGSRGELYY